MRTILFVDFAGLPYSSATLESKATGGTIAAIVRVAEELAKTNAVFVLQASEPEVPTGRATYLGVERSASIPAPDVVVFIRGDLLVGRWSIPGVAKAYPSAQLLYWSHLTVPTPWVGIRFVLEKALAARKLRPLGAMLSRHRVRVVGTSRYHANDLAEAFQRSSPDAEPLRVTYCYNPLDQALYTETPRPDYDPDKLLYFSAPDRGLDRAVSFHRYARRSLPKLQLFVASPGYLRSDPRADGVINLGPLPRPTLYDHIRQSLCVLYPNTRFRECFGFVYAEANALGTPVLSHALGAASEVLGDPAQLVDCTRQKEILERLMSWREGQRPIVSARPEFSPAEVARQWEATLSDVRAN